MTWVTVVMVNRIMPAMGWTLRWGREIGREAAGLEDEKQQDERRNQNHGPHCESDVQVRKNV